MLSGAQVNGSLGVIRLDVKTVYEKCCRKSAPPRDPSAALVFDSGYSPLHRIPLLFRYSGQGPRLFLPKPSHKHTSNPEVLALQGAFQKC